MRLLTIGGGRFSGRALTGQALERGHEVTIFHRGSGPDDPWPDAEHVHADRADGFASIAGRPFDGIVDFCGYVPRELRESAAAFADADRYVFISSVSAHREDARAGATEDDDVHQPPFPDTESITWETYGPLKVACEREVLSAFGERATVVRPGYIVGPHDPTDRFTYWLRRAARGGEMVAPAPADQPLQWVDARDLATFVLDLVGADAGGIYAAITPPREHTLGEVIDAATRLTGAGTSVAWLDDAFVRSQGLVATGDDDPFPMITPDEPNAHLFSSARAVAAGLSLRSLDETIVDTLAWDDQRGAPWPMQAGLATEREAAIASAWRARA